MSENWDFADPPATPSDRDAVMLLEGSTFCLSDQSGDVLPGGNQGLYFRDTRVLTRLELLVDDRPPEPLTVLAGEPFAAVFVGRVTHRSGATLLVERHRYVGDGMREDLCVRNLGRHPVEVTVAALVGADLADLFTVRRGLAGDAAPPLTRLGQTTVTVESDDGRGVTIGLDGGPAGPVSVAADRLAARVRVGGHDRWRATLSVTPLRGGQPVPTAFPAGLPVEHSAPVRRTAAWRARVPRVTTGHPGLDLALRRSTSDLAALRITGESGEAVLAAGAPWYMAVFGRDSILSSWMALPADPTLLADTLTVLARSQGEREDAGTEEQPGRVMHEVRHGPGPAGPRSGERRYYGTADATPLFVAALAQARRWGLADAALHRLLPHADRALAWIERYGDRDGDGFVEYQRAGGHGLRNQGWKDSADSVSFADGTLAEPPIALAEVQGYTYAAYRARAELAGQLGDRSTQRRYAQRADRLAEAFNEAFWLPDEGFLAHALDARKRPVDSVVSNAGHCLWTGIVDADKARLVAERLVAPDLFTGWGVRTLSSQMDRYDPLSYHNGSVWPHDSAIVAAGLMRYGHVRAAQRIVLGLLEAAHALGGRLPELFGGFDRSEFDEPVPYPTSCSPQAWAAATPYLLLRVLLRLDPDVPAGRLAVDPALPGQVGPVEVAGLPVGGARLTIRADPSGRCAVEGLPTGLVPAHPSAGPGGGRRRGESGG